MEKSEKGKEVISPSKLVSTIVRSPSHVLGTESKTPENELPQDPAKDSQGPEFELSQPSNPTSVTSSTATNTNAGASSSRTSQKPQMGAPASDAGASGGSVSGDIGVDDAGTAGGSSIDDHRLAPSYALIHTTHQESGHILSMAAGFNGVLFTGSDRLVCEWHEGHAFARFNSSSGPINAIVLQYPEARIFCAHDDGVIRVWESDIKREGVFKPIRTLKKLIDLFKNSISLWLESCDKAVYCLCLSDSGDFIYSGSVDCTVNVWRIQGWKFVDTLRSHKGAINALAMGPRIVFTGSRDGTVKLWCRELYGEKGDKVRHLLWMTFVISTEVVNAVVFGMFGSSTGFLYAGSSDGKVRCWRKWDEDKPEVMSFHKGAVTCLALCSGSFVFSGSEDRTICVWRRENRGEFHTCAMVLTGHSGPVHCIETQEDWEEDDTGASRWVLYSASFDRTLKVWRVYDRPPPQQDFLISGSLGRR